MCFRSLPGRSPVITLLPPEPEKSGRELSGEGDVLFFYTLTRPPSLHPNFSLDPFSSMNDVPKLQGYEAHKRGAMSRTAKKGTGQLMLEWLL